MSGRLAQLTTFIDLRPDRRSRTIGAAVLALAALACLLGLLALDNDVSAPNGWLPYLGSGLLFIVACYILFPYKKSATPLPRLSRLDLLLAVLIFSLAIFMRFFRFDSLPFGTWNDESYIGTIANNILNNPDYRPLFIPTYDHPLHFYALVALSFKLFGYGTLAIRLVTVLFGLGTVAAAFGVGREMFGNRFGLILSFLFAISRWHITFSRFGVYTITLPFFELLTLWLLLRARRTRQLHDFVWAGLAFGMGLNFYIGIRLFVPVLGLYILFWALEVLRDRFVRKVTTTWQPFVVGLVAFGLGTWLTVAPLARFALTQPDVYWARSNQVSIFSQHPSSEWGQVIYTSTLEHLAMFNFAGDANGRHNLSGEPMLDPAMGVLFVLGVALTLTRLRHPLYSLFVAMFCFNLLGGILSLDFEAPQANRVFGAIPAVLFFVAVAIETMWRSWNPAGVSNNVRQTVRGLLMLGLASYVIFYNSEAYFVRQANSDRTWDEFNGTQSLTAKRMLEAGPDVTIYASMYLHNHEIIRFLAPQVTSKIIITPIGLPVREPGDRPVVIFVDRDNTWIVDEAKYYYPDAEQVIDTTPSGNPALYQIRISPEQIQALQGVTVSYWAGDSTDNQPAFTRTEKTFQADWANQPPLALPFVARWESTLYAPQSGTYELSLTSPGSASLWLDGQLILNGLNDQLATQVLAQGDHVLKIEAQGGAGNFGLRWRALNSDGAPAPDITDIPLTSLYLPARVAVQGLRGDYYNGDSWAPPAAFSRIDPFIDTYFHIIPLGRPFTVDWTGQVKLPTAGDWAFGLRINGQAKVYIDDQLVVDATEPTDYIEGTLNLSAGSHKIQIRYYDYNGGSRIHLYWTPPDGDRAIVPSSALVPYP
jgi:4-amino-4-deoxy-L-arabinose transferase-like glycosyltransferase